MDKRYYLLSLLDAYHPRDVDEIVAKDRMIEFVRAHDDCFERSLDVGHITASAWLLNKAENRVLLMHHTKLNRWVQLGGHCDGDPDVLAVAIKEAQEESGINYIIPVTSNIFDIDVHLIPANSKEKEHYHYDVRFILKVTHDADIIQNRESKELRWISKNRLELPTHSRSVLRMFDKWLEMIKQPKDCDIVEPAHRSNCLG